MISLVLPVNPIACPRPRFARGGRTYYPPAYNKFKAAARNMMPALMLDAGVPGPMKSEWIRVVLDIAMTRPERTKLKYPKQDIDNLAKSALDAMNGFLWVDDTQIVGLEATKRWAKPGHEGYYAIYCWEDLTLKKAIEEYEMEVQFV